MSAGRAGRRRIGAALLELIGTVEAGGADAHQDLARTRLGIGMVGDENLAVANRRGAHGAAT